MSGLLRLPVVYDKQTGIFPLGRTVFYEKIINAKRVHLVHLGPATVALDADDVPRVMAQFRAERDAAELLIAQGVDPTDRAAVAKALDGYGYGEEQKDQQGYFIDRVIEAAVNQYRRTSKVAALMEGRAKRAKRTRKGRSHHAAQVRIFVAPQSGGSQ